MRNKSRITLYIDTDIWKQLQEVLAEKKYPRGVPSWLAQQAFERTILELEHSANTQLDLFFDRG